MIQFRTLEDFTEENINAFILEMDDIYESHQQQLELLTEQQTPEFNTPQEALEYFGDMTLEEFKNKMREEYGL